VSAGVGVRRPARWRWLISEISTAAIEIPLSGGWYQAPARSSLRPPPQYGNWRYGAARQQEG
jgi:hypothetical protein